MKKINLLTTSLVICFGLLVACSSIKESNNIDKKEPISTTVKWQDVRETAYNQLTWNDKERIKGTWQESTLSEITLKERTGDINDKSYIGKKVYVIDFPTKDIRKVYNIPI